MALRIEYKDDLGNTHSRVWHYSEDFPEDYRRARVLKLTADGDELSLILDTLIATVPQPSVLILVPDNVDESGLSPARQGLDSVEAGNR